jgi:hypothetical protein
MAHKLDIFDTLKALDYRELDFYDRLSPENQKGFAPLVSMRWMSGVADGPRSEALLRLVNETVNRNFFDLAKYPDLQFRLMASCGLGPQKHQWIPMQAAKRRGGRIAELAAKYWTDANERELAILVRQITKDRETFVAFVNGCGLTEEETQDLTNEFDGVDGKKVKKRNKKRQT